MGSPQFKGPFPSGGHGPPPFGGAGAQFSSQAQDMGHDLAKLAIDDKKEGKGDPPKSPSTRRVSFMTSRKQDKYYEYYAFVRRGDWKVADKVRINVSQEDLQQKVAKVKRGSILSAMTDMSDDRRAQIDRLLNQKNLTGQHRDAHWECVSIETPEVLDRTSDGRLARSRKKKMLVIIAELLPPGHRRSTSQESSKPFVGERSDINEPISGKTTDKPKAKTSSPPDQRGPAPVPPPPQQRFEQAGWPVMPHSPHDGPTNAPHISHPFNQPVIPPQAPIPPYGIQIIDESPIPNGPNNGVTHAHGVPPQGQGQGNGHPHPFHPPFRQPRADNFNAGPIFRKPGPQPVIFQDHPGDRRYHPNRFGDDSSSMGSQDEHSNFDEDGHSSNTSCGDYHRHDDEGLVRRGSLVPHRRPSHKQRDQVYRQHRRGSNVYAERSPRLIEARPAGRYRNGGPVETIVARPRHRASSREPHKAIRYKEPARQVEYRQHSQPLTPTSNHSYSPSRPYPGAGFPLDMEADERRAVDHMNGRPYRRWH